MLDSENDASALSWAAFFGRPAMVRVLLAARSDPSQRNKHGLTPLACALGGTQGRWKQFSDATLQEWEQCADAIRSSGGVSVTAGYSGTPLAMKLGMTPPMKWIVIDPPPEYRGWLGAVPKGVAIATQGGGHQFEAVHVFVTERVALEKHLADLRRRLKQTGFVWVSWPKKASKVETDVTEDAIQRRSPCR